MAHRIYELGDRVLALTAGCGCMGTAPGMDARETGVSCPGGGILLPAQRIMIPRQTHSVNVAYVSAPGELPDTDAVYTDCSHLFVAVKTADCIPVLLYDLRQHMVAAIHAGWRGTVGRIVERTIQAMGSRGADLRAVIGPGISLASFEVGDEVYEAFSQAGFPMERIAQRQQRWHIDLWQANLWLLEQHEVASVFIEGTDTMTSADFYSARRDTIHTGRNINGIMLRR